MNLVEAKAALRKEAKDRRSDARAADPNREKETAINAHLLELIGSRSGKALSGYMPIRTEPSPLAAMAAWSAHSRVCLPVVQGRAAPLTFRAWGPGAEMEQGAFGAMIPVSLDPVTPHILIVPLLAFDRTGGRLGYGGGHYDRTIEALRATGDAFAVGFAYAAQAVSEVPREPTDIPMDAIVTEEEVILPTT